MQQQCPNKVSSEILFETIWQIYAASLKSNIMIKIILINLLIRDPSEWPVGPGQLTARGKRMHYHLGQVAILVNISIVAYRSTNQISS